MAYFKNSDLFKDGLVYRGEEIGSGWDNNYSYKVNEFVTYEGNLYISIINNNLGNIPGSSGKVWKLYKYNKLNNNIKDYEFSINASTITNLNHNENTEELFLYSRTYQDELILPDTIIINKSQLSVEIGDSYSYLTNNIVPIKENILYNQSVINGSFILSHNFDLNDYFIIAKDNSKVQGQLLLIDVLEQTNNSCLLFSNEALSDINIYLINENAFNKVRKIEQSVISSYSTITRHNMGSSDFFVWAIDKDSNKKVTLPAVNNLGERYATLTFQDISSNYSIYFGGTVRESTNYVDSGKKTALMLESNSSEWKLSIDSNGSILFSNL